MKILYAILFTIALMPTVSRAQIKTVAAEPDKLNFYVGIGLNSTKTSPGTSSPYYQSGGKTYTSYLPAIFAGISIPADPNIGNLIFRGEFAIGFSKYQANYQNEIEPYIPIRSSYNQSELSFTPQIIYNFYNADNFKVFAGIGLAIVKSNFSNAYYGPQDMHAAPIITDNQYDFVDFDTRLLLKAGLQIDKKCELFFNYVSSGESTNRGFFQLNRTNEQVGLDYFF